METFIEEVEVGEYEDLIDAGFRVGAEPGLITLTWRDEDDKVTSRILRPMDTLLSIDYELIHSDG